MYTFRLAFGPRFATMKHMICFARPPPGKRWGNFAAWDAKEISRRRAFRKARKEICRLLERRQMIERMYGIPSLHPFVFKFHEFRFVSKVDVVEISDDEVISDDEISDFTRSCSSFTRPPFTRPPVTLPFWRDYPRTLPPLDYNLGESN